MKKKKLTLLLLIFIAWISCLNNVSAFQIGETFARKDTKYFSKDAIQLIGDDGKAYNYLRDVYTATYSGNNQEYTIYCVDPTRYQGEPGTKFVITDVFIEGNKSHTQKAEDYGLAKILTTEANEDDFKTTGTDFDYAKSLALRIYYNGHTNRAYSASKDNYDQIRAYAALKKLATEFAQDDVFTSTRVTGDADTIHDAALLYRIGLKAESSYTDTTVISVSADVKELQEDKAPDGSDLSFTFENDKYTSNSSSSSTSETKEITKRFMVTVRIKNFDAKNGKFTFDSFNSGFTGVFSTNVVGVSTVNTTDFSKYTPISYNTNVFETYKDAIRQDKNGNNTLTLYIAIETKGTITTSDDNTSGDCKNCQDSTAVFSYSYSDPSVLIGAEIHRDLTSTGYQRFLVASKSKNENSGTIEIPINACSESCGNSSGPDDPDGPDETPCEPVECEGDDCFFDATLPQICSDDATVDKDGLVEYKFIEAYTGKSFDVVKCILKAQKDAANNPYLLVDNDNAEAVNDNPYCSVLCKEDYSLRLPYKQIVEEGRYFKVTLSIKGQQDCYSTKIDNDTFEDDIKAIKKEIVKAINEWNVYYELANGTESDLSINGEQIGCKKPNCVYSSQDSSCHKYENGLFESTTFYTKQFFFGNSTVIYYAFDEFTGNVSAIAVNSKNLLSILDSPSQTLIDDINRYYGSINEDPYPNYTCQKETKPCDKNANPNCQPSISCKAETGGTCLYTSPIADFNNHKADYQAKLEEARKRVENKVDELKQIIDDYNSCVGDKNYNALSKNSGNTFWNMIYRYDPEIKYSYDEPDPTNPSRSKWIDDVASLDCDGTPCNTLYSTDEEIIAEDCPDNSPVKCTEIGANGTFKSVFFEGNETDPDDAYVNTYCIGDINDDYSCQGTTLHSLDQGYNNETFFVCDYSGGAFKCYNTQYPVTKVNYVHKSAIASGKYDSRPVYYTEHHSGDIRIMYPEQDTLNYSQVPGLPVSADTPQGTYIYILGLENIGTFFNTGELGRIYGSKSNSLSTKVRLDKGSTSTTFPVTTGTGDNATDSDVEIKVNEYACTYVVSQSSCVDMDGQVHTSDECEYGTLDSNWNECKKRICNTDPDPTVCKDANGTTHTESECFQDETREECEQRLCHHDEFICTDQFGQDHRTDECQEGESKEDCILRLCPGTPNTCEDPYGNKHSEDECHDGESWAECEQRLCPPINPGDTCKDPNGKVHDKSECNAGEDWDTCKQRICQGPDPAANYCVKEAQSYYICSTSSYSKDTCIKAGSRAEAIAGSRINYNCCPNCEVVCVGKCLYVFPNNKTNDGEVQFQFRPVSPNNMNPNSRPLGYNWDLNNPSNSLIAQKATDTILEIETRASDTTNYEDDYTLMVDMTPDMVNYIKEYNNDQLSQGAYNNDTLNCYDYELDGYDENTCKDSGYIWKDDKCIMSKVFCYSTFIDSLIENFPNDVQAPNRDASRNSSHSGFRPYTGIANSSQNIITNDYWTIYKFTELDINGDGIPNIGPSWK